MQRKLSIALALMLSAGAANAASIRTAVVDIQLLRPYTNGDYFVTVSSNALKDGGTCHTVYKVNNSDDGAKAVIASLLTAYALPKQVQIELPSTGCTGFGTLIKSVFLQP